LLYNSSFGFSPLKVVKLDLRFTAQTAGAEFCRARFSSLARAGPPARTPGESRPATRRTRRRSLPERCARPGFQPLTFQSRWRKRARPSALARVFGLCQSRIVRVGQWRKLSASSLLCDSVKFVICVLVVGSVPFGAFVLLSSAC